MKKITKKLVFNPYIGVNSSSGHYILLALGTLAGFLDVYWGIRPTFVVIAIIAVLVTFPPFKLPSKGIDVEIESFHLIILTFGTAGFMGIFVGLASGIYWFSIPLAELNERIISFSVGWAFICAATMAKSFFSVGFLSREFQQTFSFQFSKLPLNVSRLLFTSSVGFKATIPSAKLLEEIAAANILEIFGKDPFDKEKEPECYPILLEIYNRFELNDKKKTLSQRKILQKRLIDAVTELKKEFNLPDNFWPLGWPDNLKIIETKK